MGQGMGSLNKCLPLITRNVKDFKAIGAKSFPSKVAVYGLLGVEYDVPGIPVSI
jgi:hypothetical protein